MKTLQGFGILLVFLIQTALSEPRWYTARDGKRYLIEKKSEYNWYQAWHECARQNAQLIAIETEEKNNNIRHLFDENIRKSRWKVDGMKIVPKGTKSLY